MKVTGLIITLVAAAALAALGQEETVEDIKHGAKKAGETVKEGLETVGEKTKEAAETVGEKTKEAAQTVAKETKKAWRDTKAYASGNRATYRKGARQRLNDLSKEIADLKARKSEASDPQSFDRQLDTLTQQEAAAKGELANMKKTASEKDYSEARKRFDATIREMEDGVAQARKQLRE
jgi:arylsulfatase A-like enzyme